MQHRYRHTGFTLIEISIVIVIIGLITGSILVGSDLIKAAKIRAQVKQIEDYRLAAQAFRLKYNAIAGDLKASQADSFGFVTRSGARGHGDGNGMLERCDNYVVDWALQGCELALFWADLSKAQLIADGFTETTDTYPTIDNPIEASRFFPRLKISDPYVLGIASQTSSGKNWMVSIIINNQHPLGGSVSGIGFYPMEAFSLDNKLDDGHPTQGTVRVFSTIWPNDGVFFGAPSTGASQCLLDSSNYNVTYTAYPRCQMNFFLGM